MAAGQYDITIEQGADLDLVITWTDSDDEPIDLTGASARMQVRRTHDNATALLDIPATVGTIVLGDELGTITVNVPAADTEGLPAPLKAFYDLEIVEVGGAVRRVVEGFARITPEVTRT